MENNKTVSNLSTKMQELEAQLKKLKNTNKLMDHEVKEIKKGVRDLFANEKTSEDEKRKAAHKLYLEACNELNEVDKLPHDCFAKGQVDIVRSRLDETKELLQKTKMYEAVVAMYISAKIEASLIANSVKNEWEEWETYFQEFKGIMVETSNLYQIFREDTKLSEADLSKWSGGLHSELYPKLKRTCDFFPKVEGKTIPYLLSGKAPNTQKLRMLIQEARELKEKVLAMMECIKKEKENSIHRNESCTMMAYAVDKEGYTIYEAGFQNEDDLEIYSIIYTMNGVDFIRLYAVPDRSCGVCSGNKFYITIESNKLRTDTEKRQILKKHIGMAKEVLEQNVQAINDDMTIQKNSINIEKYVKYREMKKINKRSDTLYL